MDNGSSSYDRYLAGDDSAMGELVHEYKDGLTVFLNSFTNDLFEAEELMEETFFKLAYKKPKYSGKSSFRTWLYSIARNLAIDYLRKNKKVKAVSVDECYGISDNVDIEDNYLTEERKIIVHKLIQKLKYEYRQVICLVYIEGFSNSETALIMHKNNRQITNLLYQAKKALRSELEKEGITYAGL
ncbi:MULTISPECIES: RNA polymerase sigma factor [Ruminococcus]|uniref:RNA polymerase sigma-70 factor, ECF subfamily n=1 Tax=Ruminococcus flavefaciens TaxID=1265 RepID=A0A1M7M925_RUMFL|nr:MULTISPECIES: RNA polymerase sigma factor [Ruminococcus]MCR4794147.1 RNA polymerase sigma factor [Ruminococcus sp.]SHM87281.1 RNA polymerase sigma-70 factor, ECF subfamily [Ruminococcus flavefaciens]